MSDTPQDFENKPLTNTEAARLDELGSKETLTDTEAARAEVLQTKSDAHNAEAADRAAAAAPPEPKDPKIALISTMIDMNAALYDALDGVLAMMPQLSGLRFWVRDGRRRVAIARADLAKL